MDITEVRVKLMEDSDDRLQAFCSITFDDCFVVRDLKIIDGTNGPFVAMPSRKLTSHCQQCGSKNHLKAAYCNQCGARQREDRTLRDSEGRTKLYADIAHPINSGCREMIQNRVIAEFRAEQDKSKQPGYVSRYDDDYDDDVDPASLLPPEEEHKHPSSALSTDAAQPDTHVQPPPPHMPTAPAISPEKISSSTGGPHFNAPPQRETVKESKEPATKPKRGNFGEGLFE